MIRYSLLALALVGAAGVAHAQAPLDPYGRPYISAAPQPTPGDYTREAPGLQPMNEQAQAISPYRSQTRHDTAFKDEYGFRYDDQGHRIDSAGRHISPRTTTP